jgi:hypothetical protein
MNKVELLNIVKNTKRLRQAVSLLPVERTGHLRPSLAQERCVQAVHGLTSDRAHG